MFHFILFLFLSFSPLNNCFDLDFGYHKYDSLTSILKNYSQNYPNKVYLYSIGKSVLNRDLWVLALADSNPDKHVSLRPEAKYIGNIHGDEGPTRETLLHLIDYMIKYQSIDSNVDFIMKNTRVHVLVSMNPDGFEKSVQGDCVGSAGHLNENNVNLNRNFPDYFECNTIPIQPETQSVINWLDNNEFILSIGFHTGSIVASYPFDNINSNSKSNKSLTMDTDVFEQLALNYSFNHANMRYAKCGDESFQDGITNGANWPPPIRGSMGDFNYWRYGCLEITVESSCCLNLPSDQLELNWLENKKSLLDYLKKANTGVRGIVTFANGQLAVNMTVRIDYREPYFKTNKYGEYYRILLPGTYELELMFNCDAIYGRTIKVLPNQVAEINIQLSNNLYPSYLNNKNKMDKYALFCTRDKYPANCNVNSNDSSSITSLKYSYLTIYVLIYFILFLK